LRPDLRTILVHAIVWCSFIAYEIGVAKGIGSTIPLGYFACFYLLGFTLFYFNAHVASPAAAKRKYPAVWVSLVLIIELGVYDLLSIGMDILVTTIHAGRLTVDIDQTDFIRGIWRGVYYLGLSTGYFLGMRSMANARKAHEILQLKLKGELREVVLENAHLRAQINPHFLFNTLSFIYNTVESVSDIASECIDALSASMAYAMMPPQHDGKIELYKEIEQIERYIYLNQLRFKNRIRVHMTISPECYMEHLRIPPLLLTLVENIFKHGNLDAPVLIAFDCLENNFHFRTENLKAGSLNTESNHIGLTNVKLLLQHYYNDDCEIQVEQLSNTFILDLKLKL